MSEKAGLPLPSVRSGHTIARDGILFAIGHSFEKGPLQRPVKSITSMIRPLACPGGRPGAVGDGAVHTPLWRSRYETFLRKLFDANPPSSSHLQKSPAQKPRGEEPFSSPVAAPRHGRFTTTPANQKPHSTTSSRIAPRRSSPPRATVNAPWPLTHRPSRAE